jgi:hypothetical protein
MFQSGLSLFIADFLSACAGRPWSRLNKNNIRDLPLSGKLQSDLIQSRIPRITHCVEQLSRRWNGRHALVGLLRQSVFGRLLDMRT